MPGETGRDCELFATPDIQVELAAGQEVTWTMDVVKMEMSAGSAKLRLTLHWYGGPFGNVPPFVG